MSTVVHSFFLGPSDTVRVFCVDGLSSLDIQKIDDIYDFGGKFQLVDCGVGYEYVVLQKAAGTMGNLYFTAKNDGLHSVEEVKDIKEAFEIDNDKWLSF